MESGPRLIYVMSVVIVVAAVVILVLAVLPHSAGAQTVWPLGDKDCQYDRDVGVGTTYTYSITGTDTLDSGEVVDITGTMTGKVTAADEGSYTCEETTVFYEQGQETRYIVTTTYDRSGNIKDSVYKSSISSDSGIDTSIDPKWGPHSLDIRNYTVVHGSIKHFYCTYDGKEDKVCYKVLDTYSICTSKDGHEYISSYKLTDLLISMSFHKYV